MIEWTGERVGAEGGERDKRGHLNKVNVEA